MSLAVNNIPSDWKLKRLKDVANFSNGKGHEKGIDENGEFIVVNSKFISTDTRVKKFSKQNLCPLKKNDITIVMSDIPNGKAIAKCFIVDEDNRYTLNQRIGSITVKEGVNTKFIYYVLNRNRYYLAFDNGVGQTNLRKDEVINCPIQFPPLPEQQKIADILSTVDAKIEVIYQQITKTQDLKKGLMQRLLTKGIGHTEFKDSALGEIPVGWEVVRLDDVCEVIDPHPSHRAPKEDSEGYPFVGIGDISENGTINLEKTRKISLQDVEKQKQTYTLEENDMGFGRVASIGKVVWFKKQEFPYAISPTMALIKIKRVDPFYCYQFLSSSVVTDQFRMLSVGSTRTSIGMKSLRTLKFLLPNKSEQIQISEILTSVDEKLDVLLEKKTAYQELKKGLMQQLLTGKVRVKV